MNGEKQASIIKEHLEELSSGDGELSTLKMWKLKKKLSPQNSEAPIAMQDSAGNLVTGKVSLRKLYQETYKERPSHKPIENGWEEIQLLKECLFKERLKFSSEQNTVDWDVTEIKKVCTKLKSGKARDRDDLVFLIQMSVVTI